MDMCLVVVESVGRPARPYAAAIALQGQAGDYGTSGGRQRWQVSAISPVVALSTSVGVEVDRVLPRCCSHGDDATAYIGLVLSGIKDMYVRSGQGSVLA